jgi:hypothetical protein
VALSEFAAVQRYGRCQWNTGRSVDAADTAAPAPSRFQPLARKPVGADIQNFTSGVAIDRSVNWLPGIADARPDQLRPLP